MKDNQLQTVTFEQAKRLKNAGFDWNTSHYYEKVMVNGLCRDIENDRVLKNSFIADWGKYKLSAPTVVLALKWFRDVKGVYCAVEFYGMGKKSRKYSGALYKEATEKYPHERMPTAHFDTYEAAESALLDELLTLIENGK